MKLRTKLSLSFLLVALAIVAIGVPVLTNSNNIGASFYRLDKESVPQILSLQKMHTDSVIVYSRALEYTVEDNATELQDYRNEIAEARADFGQTFASFESASSPSDRLGDFQSMASVKQDWIDFNSKTDKVLELVDSKAGGDAVSEAREDMESSQEKFSSSVDATLRNEQAQNQVLQLDVESALQSSFLLTIFGFAVAAVFAIALGNIIAKKISTPVIRLRNALDDIVRGKYETKIPKTPSDEIGDLVAHFNSVQEQLKEKEKMQKEFLMIASHELRTPIQPILAYSDLAQKGVVPPKKAFETISSEAKRLKRLSDDIIDASKIEADKMDYAMERINAGDFFKEIVERARATLGSDNPTVSVVTTSVIPASSEIYGDRQRLYQAVWNIVDNAIRFTSQGVITLSCNVLKKGDSKYFELRIQDTGAGIPDELVPHLFKKFSSRDPAGTAKHGTGLGLFISKSIIEAHGGTIMAVRNKESGTTFTVALPLSAAADSMLTVSES